MRSRHAPTGPNWRATRTELELGHYLFNLEFIVDPAAVQFLSSSLGSAGFAMENLIWFRLLVVLAILLALASAGNGTTALKSNLNSGSRGVTYMHEKIHLLHRKKRWLTFELGSSLTVGLI